MSATVAVLFARQDSIYKTIPDCDVYDIDRDARTWQGGLPIIAHPPCRAWGSLRHFAKPRPDEKALATWAVDRVREFGGVLEHPMASTLWAAKGLPRPGAIDEFGGWTLPISQNWWGHRAEKKTFLYIVGCRPRDIPEMPMVLGEATHVISPAHSIRVGHPRYRPQLRKDEREHTPPALAAWLYHLARRCQHQLAIA
jgi:hypothetical protein